MDYLSALEDYLFLLILSMHVLQMMKQTQKKIKSIFFQEERLKID